MNTLKGTRDFSPVEVRQRDYIFTTLKRVFTRFGFQPIETPTMEALDVLLGKYGEEGDKLLFKVLNNGDFLKKADPQALETQDSDALLKSIAKRGLRYDLTVPFARYVVQHRNDIAFPFKRYQVQPVWRADRPQKGRYQEFYQCDVDVIGSNSLLYEVELLQIYDQAFAELGIDVVLRLNNRKILEGLAHYCGHPAQFMAITVAIDKLDKIGWTGVAKELEKIGLDESAQQKVKQVLDCESLDTLATHFAEVEIGLHGVQEIQTVCSYLTDYTWNNTLAIDFTLARGLSYYTGCIFEVIVNTDNPAQAQVKMGSIGGGGRYDDLTGIFGMPDMSGVGVSFGAARIYDVMKELQLFKAIPEDSTQLIFLSFDEATHRYAFQALQKVRAAGIAAELYPEPVKLKKQMKYANSRQIPYVIIVGENEMQSGEFSLKHMQSGEQETLNIEAVIAKLTQA